MLNYYHVLFNKTYSPDVYPIKNTHICIITRNNVEQRLCGFVLYVESSAYTDIPERLHVRLGYTIKRTGMVYGIFPLQGKYYVNEAYTSMLLNSRVIALL